MTNKTFEQIITELPKEEDISETSMSALTPHERLIVDLTYFLDRAKKFKFHDFKSDSAAPKLLLARHIKALTNNYQNGCYDNDPDTEDLADLKQTAIDQDMPESLMKFIFGDENV